MGHSGKNQDVHACISKHGETRQCSWERSHLQGEARGAARPGVFGGAESWVEAKRLEKWEGNFDCVPGDTLFDPMTGEFGEVVALYCPQAPSTYPGLCDQWKQGSMAKGGKTKRKKGSLILPESWFAAVRLETNNLQAAGWSQPPAARKIFYRRPSGSLKTSAVPPPDPIIDKRGPVTTLRFAFYGRPLPRMEDAVQIGELTRLALMHLAEKHLGEIPSVLSGHDLPAINLHQHAYYLPECNQHGKIDHMLIHASGGFDHEHVRAHQTLDCLFTRDGVQWQASYEGAGNIADFSAVSEYARMSPGWPSVTPYLRPWHMKKNLDLCNRISVLGASFRHDLSRNPDQRPGVIPVWLDSGSDHAGMTI